ncbi:MAG: galactose mutarotase [Prevotella sp.]|nr:galactose mutarotase [Prevotella sp.]
MKNLKGFMMGVGVAAAMLTACSSADKQATTVSGLNPAAFDSTINGKKTALFILKNKNGMEVCITNYGGRIVSLVVPDKDGKPTDVVLGFDNIRQYADTLNSPSDYGSTVGRYANRINDGKIVINGDTIQLRQNDTGNGAKHCLHGGGNTGWMHQVYDADQLNDTTLVLTLVSPDGDNGFPGEVHAKAMFTILPDNTIDIVMEATTDKETVINMTNHSYFNLNGNPSKEGDNMILMVNADNYTPSDSTYMTTGEIKPVEGTPMDFRVPTPLSLNINNQEFDQIKNATGFDHNWCLNTYKDGKGDDTQVCASLYSPESGIFLEMFTNEPGVQVYSGNFQGVGRDADIIRKGGLKYPKHVSVCLESQKYPDTPNKPEWPTAIVKPGETYHSHVAYKFSVK